MYSFSQTAQKENQTADKDIRKMSSMEQSKTFVDEETKKSEQEQPPNGLVTDEAIQRDLSAASRQFDLGNKGYLTTTERKARELDVENQGCLNNDQVVDIVQKTEILQKANGTLKRWLIVLLIVTVCLALSQIATAIATARLAKDTDVNSSTGVMTVHGDGSTAVVVVATGRTHVLVVQDKADVDDVDDDDEDEDDKPNNSTVVQICIPASEFADMFNEIAQGSNTNAMIQTSPSRRLLTEDKDESDTAVGSVMTVSFVADGQYVSDTKACLKMANGGEMCTTYEPCEDGDDEGDGNNNNGNQNRNLQVRQKQQEQQEHNRQWIRQRALGTLGGAGAGGNTFDRLRYVETKHGRISMLATVGHIATEIGVRVPAT